MLQAMLQEISQEISQDIINSILAALGILITGLVGFGVTKFTQWINTKISDSKCANYLATIVKIVGDSVKSVYQTYVQSIKEQGKFDEEAQKKALEMCLATIKSKCAPELLDWIGHNFGDVTDYLKTLIESTIYNLKNIESK